MRILMLGMMMVVAVGLFAGCGDKEQVQPGPDEGAGTTVAVVDAVENQQFCPVMDGMPINKALYVDHEGQRVYFCCAACISAFEAEPEKYMEKLKEIHADPDHKPQPEAHDHDHEHEH